MAKIDFQPIESEKAAPAQKIDFQSLDPAQPGVAAIGTPSGPTPAAEESMKDKLIRYANYAMPGTGQVQFAMDYAKPLANGIANGATMGYLPQLEAAAAPPIAKVKDLVMGGNSYDSLPPYVERRDQAIKDQAAIKKANPYVYGGAQLAGGLGSTLLLPGGAALKGAGLATKLAAGAGGGAALMAAANPGDTPGVVDPLQMSERADNAKTGALLGMAGPIVGKAGEMAGPALNDIAELSAFKSLGPYARDTLKAFGKQKVNPQMLEENALTGTPNAIGRSMLDSNIIGAPTSYGGLADRLKAATDKSGPAIGDYVSKLGDAVKGLGPDGAEMGISRQAIADKVRQDLISPNVELPGVAKNNKSIEKMLQTYENGQDPQMSIPATYDKKKTLGDLVNWERQRGADIPLEEQVNRKLYGYHNEGLRNAAQAVENKMSLPNAPQGAAPAAGAANGASMPGSMPAAGAVVPTSPAEQAAAQELLKSGQPVLNAAQTKIGPPPKGVMIKPDGTVVIPGKAVGAANEIPNAERTVFEKAGSPTEYQAPQGKPSNPPPQAGSQPGQQSASSDITAGKFDELNNTHSNLKEAAKIAGRKDAKTFSNNFLSQGDYGASAVGGMAGAMLGDTWEERLEHAIAGAGLGLVTKGARLYGPQLISGGASNAARLLPQAGINPWLAPAIANQK